MTAVKKSPAGTTKAAPAKKDAGSARSASKSATKGAVPAKATAPRKAAAPAKAAASRKAAAPAKATTKAASRPAAPAKATTKAGATRAPAKSPAVKAPDSKAPATTEPAVKAPAVKKVAPEPPKRPTVGPYAKDPKFLDAQRVLLLEERTVHAGQALDLRAEADSLALEREPGDVQFDEESGEGGTVTVDRERNLALSAQASLAVEEIDDALKKLDRKSYGWCERCFDPIPKARLQALPFARLCVACKSGGLSRR